jgi:hypothetical protein
MTGLPGKTAHTKLKIAVIRVGTTLYRISDPTFPSPLFFNTDQSGRFNSPSGEYGVCYTADSFNAAFSESLGHSVATRFEPSEKKVVLESDLMKYHIFQLNITKTLHVGELCGSGLPRLNLDNNINSSPKPYSIPQQWSLWVHNHPDDLDGIRYHSRHLPSTRCEALFDRSASSISVADTGAVIDWSCPKTGKDIWDLLFDHGWDVI